MSERNEIIFEIEFESENWFQKIKMNKVMSANFVPQNSMEIIDTGIVFKGTDPIEVISDIKSDSKTGPAAYKLEKINGEVQEMRLAVGTIS
jgi:hypothetical protein